MAIEKRPSVRAKRGYVYRVRYPDPRSGRLLSATFEDERDASDFDGLWRVQRRKGALDQLDAGQQLLGDYTLEWLRAWKREKAKKTQREIVRLIDRYILDVESNGNGGVEWSRDSIAWLQLRQVDPRVIEQWMFKLQDEGIGNESLRKTLYVLQQVFRRALAFRDYPHTNQVTLIDKPKAGERRRPVVFTPDVVEKLRAIFLKRGDLMSATLVSALAYSGCRPGEILAAQCKHIRDGRLLVEQRNSIGEIVAGANYTLRHVYISLRYAAGHNPIEIAAAAGHSPTMSQDYYAAAIEAYDSKGPIDLEAAVHQEGREERA